MKYKLIYFPFYLIYISISILIIRTIWPTTLLFDQINLLSIFAPAIFILIIRNFLSKLNWDIFLFCLISTISLSLLTSTVLLNVDRSRSFYVLSWIERDLITIDHGKINLSKVKSLEKLDESAINQRIYEQKARGFVYFQNGRPKLSLLGHILYRVSNLLANFFTLNSWKANKA